MINSTPRAGNTDVWNAFMVDGASFVPGSDMPICYYSGKEVPTRLISFVDAKHIYKTKIKIEPYFKSNAYVHFYIDDQKFDGKQSSIWLYPDKAYDILCHFAGVISPDFSTYLDFPDALKRYNFYRMRAYDYWLAENGIPVIYNVRWGTEETWEYCFDGIPRKGIVSIGTVASGIQKTENRRVFVVGLFEMVKRLSPHTILVYGSSNYDCFKELSERGIRIVSFPSQTSLAFAARKGGRNHEQA